MTRIEVSSLLSIPFIWDFSLRLEDERKKLLWRLILLRIIEADSRYTDHFRSGRGK